MVDINVLNDMVEEVSEASSIAEVNILRELNVLKYGEVAELSAAYEGAIARLTTVVETEATQTPGTTEELLAKIEELNRQLQGIKPAAMPKLTVTVARAGNKYKLLSTDVSWSTVPQVHAIMAILEAHVKVGDVVEESKIVEMMVANEQVLNTRQGGKKIWNYYKGEHERGLEMHGNVEKV